MMTLPTFQLLIATRNLGKVQEIKETLANLPIKLRYLEDFFDVVPVEETGLTYEDNAIRKALEYSKQTGLWALADDSGLEVDGLGGMPGVHTARYGGDGASDNKRTAELLVELDRYPDRCRRATFVCSMAIAGWKADADASSCDEPRALAVTEGRCEGVIALEPRGANGFGFDPVFIPVGYDISFAELPSRVKAVISHRARALAAMREFLEPWLNANLTVT